MKQLENQTIYKYKQLKYIRHHKINETVTSSEAIEASGNSVSVTETDEKVSHKEKDTSIEDTTYTYEWIGILLQ